MRTGCIIAMHGDANVLAALQQQRLKKELTSPQGGAKRSALTVPMVEWSRAAKVFVEGAVDSIKEPKILYLHQQDRTKRDS